MPAFDARHYVPILKGKRGEFDALAALDHAIKERCTPLIEVVSVPWDYDNDTPSKSLEDHLDSFAVNLARGWGSQDEAFVDSIWIEPDAQAGGSHHLEYLFTAMRDGRVPAVPVGGLTRGVDHAAGVRTVAREDARGAGLRLDPDDVVDAGLGGAVDQWLSDLSLGPDSVDLIIDFGDIGQSSPAVVRAAAKLALGGLPHAMDWRSLTLASGAFPQFLVDIDANSDDTVDRRDWDLWKRLRGQGLQREPTFGDYAIAHPALLETDARNLRPTASIRYTTEDAWLVVKRRWIRHGFDQFRDASAILAGRSEYRGSGHCAGCAFIAACAAGGSTGNLTTWRRVGTMHHIVLTTEQLAALP